MAACGAPTWIIADSLRHKYYQIDGSSHLLLSVWREAASLEEVVDLVKKKYGLEVSLQNARELLEFLQRNYLCDEDESDTWRKLYKTSLHQKRSYASALLHNYLFFKIPLFRPQPLLQLLIPTLTPFFTTAALKVVMLSGILGMFLVSRQWNEFISTAFELGSPSGMLMVAVTLFVVKACHEMGHALAAAYVGCRVPVMGIAFMMLVPVLYADVSDAWRLADRRKRLVIDLAGVAAELGIASIASVAWIFLPPGDLKTSAFIAASTSWIMSLSINLNPLMRFDGYYALSDFLGIENLEARASSLATWKLRRTLFAPNLPAPEQLPHSTVRLLLGYAVSLWIYRVLLYAGIALVVYEYFFKALGLLLFVVEVSIFIIRPIIRELRQWPRAAMENLSLFRLACSMMAGLSVLAICIIPIPSRVSIPTVLSRGTVTAVFPPSGGMLESINVGLGAQITANQVIAILSAPELDARMDILSERIQGIKLRLNRTAADEEDRSSTIVLQNELESANAKLEGLRLEKAKLTIRSSQSGSLVELDQDLHDGVWVSPKTQLAVVGSEDVVLSGYISDSDFKLVRVGDRGLFVPEDPGRGSIEVKVTRIGSEGILDIAMPELASLYGGVVKSKVVAGRIVAAQNYFSIEFAPELPSELPSHVVTGSVTLTGERRSLGLRLLQNISAILVREAAF